ncbi:hypothetical protein FACS189427_01080 [Planctomycetales bacterium]|nr:hypothetical protein FACS189427_01080 [Planctomycetales bacterium]
MTFLRKILFVFTFTAVFPLRLFASDADFRFADGLLKRQMFESVEYFCNIELKDSGRTLADKYTLAAQLVRSRTLQMLISGKENRQKIAGSIAILETDLSLLQTGTIQQADELAALLFQLQLGISEQAIGEEQFRESELLPLNERSENTAEIRKTLHKAIERLQVNREKVQLLRNRTSQNGDLSFSQRVVAAEHSFTYQIGTAQVALAITWEDDNRNELLKQSIDSLYPIASMPNDSPVIFQCKIKLAQCYRLLNEKEKYTELLGQLNSGKYSSDITFQTELLRYYSFTGNTSGIVPVILKGRADSFSFPEYDLARIEILLHTSVHSSKSDETPEERKLREDTIIEIAGSLERNAGFYWGRRARNLIAETVAVSNVKEQSNPAMLAALAEEQFHQKRYTDSAQLFEQAERAAKLNGNSVNTFTFGSSSVGVLYSEIEQSPFLSETAKNEKRKVLIGKVRAFSLRHFAEKDAAEYHLKAIDLASQELEASRMTPDDYIMLLKEHTAMWASSPKTPPLLLRTALLLVKQNRTAEALTVMEKIPNQRNEFIRQLSEEERQRLDGEVALQAANSGKVQEAVNVLTDLLTRQPNNTENWIALAEILTEQTDENSLKKALQIWLKIEQQSKSGSENWRTARIRIIEVLVKQERKDEAAKAFELLKILYPDMNKERMEHLEKILGR